MLRGKYRQRKQGGEHFGCERNLKGGSEKTAKVLSLSGGTDGGKSGTHIFQRPEQENACNSVTDPTGLK